MQEPTHLSNYTPHTNRACPLLSSVHYNVFSLLSGPLFRAAEMEALPAAFSLVEPKEMKDLPLPQDYYCADYRLLLGSNPPNKIYHSRDIKLNFTKEMIS